MRTRHSIGSSEPEFYGFYECFIKNDIRIGHELLHSLVSLKASLQKVFMGQKYFKLHYFGYLQIAFHLP